MATARSTFRTDLLYALGNRSDLTNAKLDTWLNEGLLELVSRLRVRQTEVRDTSKTFTIGANTLTFPTGMIAILHIRNSTLDRPMEPIDWPRYRQMRITSGTPNIWAVFGATVYFDKNATAANALDIYGITPPTWAAGDAATPGVDDQLEYGIKLLARAHAHRDLGDVAKANQIENPMQPGTGEFWAWARANRLPSLQAGMAPRQNSFVHVRTDGYEGLS